MLLSPVVGFKKDRKVSIKITWLRKIAKLTLRVYMSLKIRNLPIERSTRGFPTQLALRLTLKYYVRLERFSKDKPSNLFCVFITGSDPE